MSRTHLLTAVIGVATGAAIVLALAGEPETSSPDAPGASQSSRRVPVATSTAGAKPTAPAISKKTTAQWIADTTSGDAATRAAAISALAEAPRQEVIPVLGRLLTDGEPEVDRVLALRSLRDLALNQGDTDGAIREAIRHVIYHGDDLTRIEDVQEALDVIEESLQSQ